MSPFLTPLQIFENYKKANHQKCKGKSTTEICRLAGLSDKQITELKTSSAWLFCFDKETANTSQEFSMTQILGGNFKKTQVKSEQNNCHNIDIKKVVNDVINFKNRTTKFTGNISTLENIISTNISRENIVEFLEKYESESGQTFFDLIASYKFVNNDKRKQITINIFNKLINAAKENGQELTALKQLGTEEIKYQFDKSGFINNDNINEFFNALISISKREKTNEKATKQDKYINNFKIPKYKSKKETISKILNTVNGKLITYTLDNDNKIQEEYGYNNQTKKFLIIRRTWINSENKTVKASTYYDGDESKLNGIYFYNNNGLKECHIFNLNGLEVEASYRNNDKYRYTKFGRNGYAIESTNVTNPDNNKRNEKTIKYDKNRTEIRSWEEAIWDGIVKQEDNRSKYISALYALSPEELDFGPVDYTIPMALEKYDNRTQINVMKILFEKLGKLDNNSNAKYSELEKKSIDYIEKEEDIFKSWSCFIQAYGRITKSQNKRKIKNDTPTNGKIDKDFTQGNFGTCWLTAAIKSLTMSIGGQKILNSTIKKDSITGDIIVTLKGAPKNQQVYRYTQLEIDASSELSSGEGDERAIEMAFRDLLLKDNKFSNEADNTTNGNDLSTAYEILTGEKPEVLFDNYGCDINTKNELTRVKNSLDTLVNKKNFVALCSFSKDFTSKYTNKSNGITSQELHTGHAYCLKSVDKNFVYVINPWDTSKTEKIKREDFEHYCSEITMANI